MNNRKWIASVVACVALGLGLGLMNASPSYVRKSDEKEVAARYPMRSRTPDFFERAKTKPVRR